MLLESEKRVVQGKLVDVSREGMGVVSPEPFDRDASIRVTVVMELEQSLASVGREFTTTCHVRNCTPDGAGGFKIGMVLKERTGRELTNWSDLIQKWSAKIW